MVIILFRVRELDFSTIDLLIINENRVHSIDLMQIENDLKYKGQHMTREIAN